MEARDVLDQMIHRFETKGWIQHASWTFEYDFDLNRLEPAKACLQGACDAVTDQVDTIGAMLRDQVSLLLWTAITELFPDRVTSTGWTAVIDFNDDDDTTFEDVMLVVKHAREAA